jgi:D-alanyl-D-alanine carboxypeptidase/D-alanyl-D-alanine-endopeptidase (penicillin-binding protein 4)
MKMKYKRRTAAAMVAVVAWATIFSTGAVAQSTRHEKKKARKGLVQKEAAAGGAVTFAKRTEAILAATPVSKGEWGLLIEDAGSGETLYEQNSSNYFVPASNMKLFTTALALEKLGLDYRFHTTLESTGAVSPDGELSASLILVGRGDPNLSNRKFPFELKEEFDGPPEKALAELADALVAKGVKAIYGDVVADDSYFSRERYPNGWEIDDMVWEYGGAISALIVDDNTATVTLTPGQNAGEAVTMAVAPSTRELMVESRVATSPAGIKPDLTLTREPGARLVSISGNLPEKSAPKKLILGIQEPALHAAQLLQELLVQRGVFISGVPRALHDAVQDESSDAAGGARRQVLAEHVSVPLRDSVKLVNKISQNLHTEALLRTAMRQKGTWNSPDELIKFPAEFYAQAGIAAEDVIQTDGSGLSRHDLVTPRAIVTLLRYAQGRPWFGAYYASLPVAGIDGTLEERMKNTPAAGRVHAKTGSVEHVRSMSGFADTAGGRRLVFSFMANNQGGKGHETTDALGALCVAMVEEFNSVPAKRAREHKRPH